MEVGEPHFGHGGSCTFGSTPPAAGVGAGAPSPVSASPIGAGRGAPRSRALRHAGYAEHARNGPRRPLRTTMSAPHFSHFSSVFGWGTGLPSASTSIAFLHSG